MRLQLLSDLHLETEIFDPEPAPSAELLVLAGDIDSDWTGLERFRGWPVPVLFVAGNHEFDRRELSTAWPALRDRAAALGLTMLERESIRLKDARGRQIRFVATTRWCDFDLFGIAQRARCMRAARYFVDVMRSTQHGRPLDTQAVRDEALVCRDWLQKALFGPTAQSEAADATVVVTHYAPSLLSLDPRYGSQPGSASFCNDDMALLPGADLWLHGHLHCRHDYRVVHAGSGPAGDAPRHETRVVSNARGHTHKGETDGYDALRVVEV